MVRAILLTLCCALAAAFAAALAAGAGSAGRAPLTVYAASSLTDVLPRISPERYSFGGSNTLAAQIRQGAPADVFASANTKLPAQLHAAGLCSKPVVFTRNALVVVVPRSNPAHIRRISDLEKRNVRLVVAAPGVPVGDYTVQVLQTLQLARPVLRNVVSRETDVRAVLAKVALGEADAGFVYSTDARTVAGRIRVVTLPARAEADVRYGACVVSTSGRQADSRAFVTGLLGAAAQAKLRAAGFLPRLERAATRR